MPCPAVNVPSRARSPCGMRMFEATKYPRTKICQMFFSMVVDELIGFSSS